MHGLSGRSAAPSAVFVLVRPAARRMGMKRLLAFVVLFVLAVWLQGLVPALATEGPDGIPACDDSDPDYGTNCEDAEEEGAELRDGYLDARQIPGDVITPGDIDLADQQAAAIPEELRGLVNPDWAFVGPSNVGGRVTDIAPDATHPGQVYVAVATAGLWKSTDGGLTMTKAWPDTFPQSLGAVTVAPNGDVWVGTGEVNPGGGSLRCGWDCLYRSSDQGATWTCFVLKGTGTTGTYTLSLQDAVPGRGP